MSNATIAARIEDLKADHRVARAMMAFGVDADTRARAARDAKRLADEAFTLRLQMEA